MPTTVLTWTQWRSHSFTVLEFFCPILHTISHSTVAPGPLFSHQSGWSCQLYSKANSLQYLSPRIFSVILPLQLYTMLHSINLDFFTVSSLALYINYLLSIYPKIMNQKKRISHFFLSSLICSLPPLSLTISWHFLMNFSHQLAIFGRLTCLAILPSSHSI